jgi:catechol 2,3-dioxygenase-like lactoylglutathione lyase family enzyme
MAFSRSVSHLGLMVSDLYQALDFYTQALGCYLSTQPVVVSEGDGSRLGELASHMLGTGWQRLKLAHLTAPDETGLDLVEIEGAAAPVAQPAPRRIAMFRLHALDPDLGGMVRRIIEHGGTSCTTVRTIEPAGRPCLLLRCEDPFGNVIEIAASDPELAFSYGP